MSGIFEVTDRKFQTEVLDSEKPTLVDFWSPWCMSCRMMSKVLEEFALNNPEKVRAVKLNTDQNRTTASIYSIKSIPSLLVFKGGCEILRTIGVQPADVLEAEIDKVL